MEWYQRNYERGMQKDHSCNQRKRGALMNFWDSYSWHKKRSKNKRWWEQGQNPKCRILQWLAHRNKENYCNNHCKEIENNRKWKIRVLFLKTPEIKGKFNARTTGPLSEYIRRFMLMYLTADNFACKLTLASLLISCTPVICTLCIYVFIYVSIYIWEWCTDRQWSEWSLCI